MAKPFVYNVIPATSGTPAGGEIPIGTTVHQSCDICKQVGNGFVLNGHNKYNAYDIAGVVIMKPSSGTTEIGVSVIQDGNAVPGGTFYSTVGGAIAIPMYCVVTTECGHPSSITLQTTADVDILGGCVRVGTR